MSVDKQHTLTSTTLPDIDSAQSVKQRKRFSNDNALTKFWLKIVFAFQTCIHYIGSSVHKRSAWFVSIFPVVTFVLAVISNTVQRPPDLTSPDVRNMFVVADPNEKMKLFNQEWFDDTWSSVGYSAKYGNVILRSKNGDDVLTDVMIKEAFRIHDELISIKAVDAVLNRTISFRDVCKKKTIEPHDVLAKVNGNGCYVPPIIDYFQRTKDGDSTNLQIFADGKMIDVTAVRSVVNQTSSSPSDSDAHPTKKGSSKKFFAGTSIGWIDGKRNSGRDYILSARALRFVYLLNDTDITKQLDVACWLREFEESIHSKINEKFLLIATTSESIASHWISLVSLKTVHVVILCGVTFLALVTFITYLNGIATAFFLGVCGTASLAMALICTNVTHRLISGNPSFNEVQGAVFVSAFQALLQVCYLSSFLSAPAERTSKLESTSSESPEKRFTDAYYDATRSSLLTYLTFVVIFTATACSSNNAPSLQSASITNCLGFTMCYLLQSLFMPACICLFDRHLRAMVVAIRQPASQTSLSIAGDDIADDRGLIDGRRSDRQLCRTFSRATRKPDSRIEKLKKKLDALVQAYFDYVVSTYMRPATILVYLTYASFCYVGCLHFIEQLEPRHLLPVSSDAYRYIFEYETGFQQLGPKFVVAGQIYGEPWQYEVVRELFQVHESIVAIPSVSRELSTSWFEQYLRQVTHGQSKESAEYEAVTEGAHFAGSISNMLDGFAYSYSSEDYDSAQSIQQATFRYDEEGERKLKLELPQNDESRLMAVWRVFCNTSEFREKFASNIRFENSSKLSSRAEMLISFRWFYQVNESSPLSTRETLLDLLQQVTKKVNQSIFPVLYVDSPAFDWWRFMQMDIFLLPSICIGVLGIVVLLVSISARTFWQAFVGTFAGASTAFGISGMLSFYSIGLDPFSFSCVLFALPYSFGLVSKMLETFADGTNGGRAHWARISLRRVAGSNLYSLLVFLFSTIALVLDPSHSFRSPLLALLCLAFAASSHVFFFLPVLMTVFSPDKKEARDVPAISDKRRVSQMQANALTDSRPHLHARRYYYDTQRAASFQSEEDEDRSEKITSL